MLEPQALCKHDCLQLSCALPGPTSCTPGGEGRGAHELTATLAEIIMLQQSARAGRGLFFTFFLSPLSLSPTSCHSVGPSEVTRVCSWKIWAAHTHTHTLSLHPTTGTNTAHTTIKDVFLQHSLTFFSLTPPPPPLLTLYRTSKPLFLATESIFDKVSYIIRFWHSKA